MKQRQVKLLYIIRFSEIDGNIIQIFIYRPFNINVESQFISNLNKMRDGAVRQYRITLSSIIRFSQIDVNIIQIFKINF